MCSFRFRGRRRVVLCGDPCDGPNTGHVLHRGQTFFLALLSATRFPVLLAKVFSERDRWNWYIC